MLLGMVFGCGAAVSMPSSSASAARGAWTCFHGSVMRTADDSGAQRGRYHSRWMNKIAPNVAAGTVIALPDDDMVVCVKR